jgi:hypothetical protein
MILVLVPIAIGMMKKILMIIGGGNKIPFLLLPGSYSINLSR